MLNRQRTLLDWFRDQERRLGAWREELASRGADAEELEKLERQRHWLAAEIDRLASHVSRRTERMARP